MNTLHLARRASKTCILDSPIIYIYTQVERNIYNRNTKKEDPFEIRLSTEYGVDIEIDEQNYTSLIYPNPSPIYIYINK